MQLAHFQIRESALFGLAEAYGSLSTIYAAARRWPAGYNFAKLSDIMDAVSG